MLEEAIIEVHELTKVYGEGPSATHALRGISSNVKSGEFIAIMGPSGSGKSTLMNIIGCLDRPTSGTYILDGEDVSDLSRAELAEVRNQKIGFIFQSFNLLPRLTALQNLMLPTVYDVRRRWDEYEREDRAIAALEAVGLGDRIDHRPNELSGGQQQRVAIARALVNEPAIILADEPTGNLDTRSGVEVMKLLEKLHQQGSTIVMVTHDPRTARYAERVICVQDGLLVEDAGNNPCVEIAFESEVFV
jgi:putative ABC transport system ATP-binding protein